MAKSTEEDYAAAGFSGELGFGRRPALALIDFVGAYFIESSPLYARVESVLAGAVSLLAAARRAKLVVVHTRVAYAEDGVDGGIFFRKVPALKAFALGADPAMGAIHRELAPAPGEIVIIKQYASAFFGTSLSSTLTAAGVDTLIIGGLSTSGCVRATATDAIQHGFIPIVVRDAVGDRDSGVHEANLFDLSAKYADVVALTDVQAYLGVLRGGESRK